jgi:hypothetical protein
VAYVAALVVGVPLAEAYCVADERAFRREARAAHAAPAAGGTADDTTFYSRTRWWPGDAQILVSESPPPR